MRKNIISSIILLGSIPAIVHANGSAVNCRVEVVDQKPIYGGKAVCVADYVVNTCVPTQFGVDITKSKEELPIIKYIDAHDSSSIRLTQLVSYTENYVNGYKSCSAPKPVEEFVHCTANLDVLRYEDVKGEVCDYLPYVRVKVNQFSQGEAAFVASTSDDGTIVRREWTINGVPSSSSPFTTYVSGDEMLANGPIGQTLYACLHLTDDQGYKAKACAGTTIKDDGSLNPYEPGLD